MQTNLTLSRKIANAACFFDTAKNAMAPIDQSEASQHIEKLHRTAQLLAGEHNAAVYLPGDSEFEQGEHYVAMVNIDQSTINTTHWRKDDGLVVGCLTINSYPFNFHLNITPAKFRQLAAMLWQCADDMEASAAQRAPVTMLEAA